MKTLIAVPCMDQVAAPFAQSLAALEKEGQCVVSFLIGSLIYDSRNQLAKQAMKYDADYVMWLDSDMIIPADALKKMLRHMEEGLDIVTGLYFRRRPPYTPVLFKSADEEGKWEGYDEYPDELFEVGGCGFGCVITRTDVLYDVAINEKGLFDPIAGFGEDISFCIRARNRGYKVMCDPSIKCGHVGQIFVNEDFYKLTKKG